MNEETIRYLVSYLHDNEDDWQHVCQFYGHAVINEEQLAATIKKFFKELP